MGRQAALFAAVVALEDQLRSVFVPYMRYLLDPAIGHLSGAAPAATVPPKKKRKKASLAEPVGNLGHDADVLLLRLQVTVCSSGLCTPQSLYLQ